MILLVILTLVIAATLFIGSGFAIRALARIPFYWVFTPANTFCLVVSDEDESGDGMTGVGNLVNVLHAVPGKRLNKNALDTMEWQFEDGEDPEHDRFSFRKLGVQSMGNIFYTTRFNVDKRMRFAREKKLKEEEEKGNLFCALFKGFSDNLNKGIYLVFVITTEFFSKLMLLYFYWSNLHFVRPPL